jgi:hypothetical protein
MKISCCLACCLLAALFVRAEPSRQEPWASFLATARSLKELGMESRDDFFSLPDSATVELPLAGPPGFRFSLVEVTLGTETLLAVFDTGASSSLITADAALRAGVVPVGRPPQETRAIGFGGSGSSVTAVAPSLHWGGGDIRRVRFSVIPGWKGLDIVPGEGQRKVEMILGYDLMRAYDWVDMLPAERRIRLGRGLPPPDFPHVAQALLPHRQGTGPRVDVTLVNGKRFPATLDTGGYFALRVPESLAEDLGLRRRDYVSLPTVGVSATGGSARHRGLPTALNIGDLQLSRVAVDIAAGNAEANDRIGALLGNPLLSRLRWTLDHRAQKIRFALPSAAGK